MAANESPVPASMDLAPTSRSERRTNGSPPPVQSKRDKKRQHIMDRVAQLSEKMSRDRDPRYREMLQKIQVDTSLVSKVNPYAERPLDAIEAEYRQRPQGSGDMESRAAQRSWLEMAGPRFEDWVHAVEDCLEQKDYSLTKYTYEFDKKSQEYRNVYVYKKEVAYREHKSLSTTVRERMINAITAKKFRLNKEKEALEISDASALLLHPNQFSLTNPASPGGTHNKRTTRLRREMDEVPGVAEGKKRKRNAADEDGSPAPQRRALDPGSTTTLWQGDRLAFRKVTGPVYSIDKLFTDKELSMVYNTVALASHKHVLTHKAKYDENGQVLSSPEGSESGNADGDEQDGSDSVPSAPMMERNVSRTTRSGGQNLVNANFTDDKLMGVEALANFEIPSNLERMIGADPKLPPTFPSTYIKGHTKSADFNTPTALATDDVNSDVIVMNVLRQYEQIHGTGSNFDSENGARRILEAAAHPARENRYAAYLQGPRPQQNEIRARLGLPLVVEPDPAPAASSSERANASAAVAGPANNHGSVQALPTASGAGPAMAQATGSIAMSRQSSASGAPMSRTSSRKGRSGRG